MQEMRKRANTGLWTSRRDACRLEYGSEKLGLELALRMTDEKHARLVFTTIDRLTRGEKEREKSHRYRWAREWPAKLTSTSEKGFAAAWGPLAACSLRQRRTWNSRQKV
jgi:hypothetical protein